MKVKGIEIDGVVYAIGEPIAADPNHVPSQKGTAITIHFEEDIK